MDYWTGLCFLNILNVAFSIPDVFYTVHLDKSTFDKAQTSCELDNSFLTNIVNQGEIAKIHQAVVNKGDTTVTSFWIGLKKNKTACVQTNLPLMGFSWIVGSSTEFDANKWKPDLHGSCTSALCGLLSLTYRGSTIDSWHLASSSCKHAYPFICKHEGRSDMCSHPAIHGSADIIRKHNDPYNLQVTCNSGESFNLTCSKSIREWRLANDTDKDISGLCLECDKGYQKNALGSCVDVDECQQPHVCKHKCVNIQGSYMCKCPDGMDTDDCNEAAKTTSKPTPFETSHELQDNQYATTMDQMHPASVQPNRTTGDSVEIEGNTGDLSNIIIPVIIALLILVVFVVLIVAIIKCCLIRRSKKQAKKRAAASKESMALNGSDSMEKINDKEVI